MADEMNSAIPAMTAVLKRMLKWLMIKHVRWLLIVI
jgi:hypothetical protein